MKEAEPVIMRAAQRNVVHKNNASRKVSRLTHRIAKLAQVDAWCVARHRGDRRSNISVAALFAFIA